MLFAFECVWRKKLSLLSAGANVRFALESLKSRTSEETAKGMRGDAVEMTVLEDERSKKHGEVVGVLPFDTLESWTLSSIL